MKSLHDDIRIAFTLASIGMLAASCQTDGMRPIAPAPPSSPGPEVSPVAPSPIPGAPRCTFMFHVIVDSSGEERALKVVVENTTVALAAFDAPDRCPNGVIDLEGLGPGYDYYNGCAKGACATIGRTLHFALGPRERKVIAETTISLGGRGCNHALAPGRHVVRAVIPAGVSGCTDEAVVEVP